jgi:hypothetical protein
MGRNGPGASTASINQAVRGDWGMRLEKNRLNINIDDFLIMVDDA